MVVVVNVLVVGGGVTVTVGVIENWLKAVIGIVIAYDVVLTDTGLAPYWVVQSVAVEY